MNDLTNQHSQKRC